VAIIGSGPSGFYAAGALLKADLNVRVSMFEQFPSPFGLVRFGVAPDHAKIRNVVKVYHQTAQDEDFRFFGNVGIGRDLSVEALHEHYDAVIFAFGAKSDRKLNIPGEELERSYTATEFCAWYNGHPEYRDLHFDLAHETAVVIGQGNVAMDVTRILAKDPDELAKTDIASHAVEALRQSQVRRIYCIGRRGPAQAKFTPKEIKELGEIDGCDLIINPADVELSDESEQSLDLPGHEPNKRNMEILRGFARRQPSGAAKQIIVRFCLSPREIRGDGGVREVVLEKNQLVGEPGNQWAEGTGETQTLPCGVFFRSVGYRGVPIPGIPFDQKKGVIPNEGGRIEVGAYVVGWIKRGPSGLIGTNKKDSEDTVEQLLADVPKFADQPKRGDEAVGELLRERGVRFVTYDAWQRIDAAEIERGKAKGKPRENFTRIDEMLAVLDK
jgi:ferredoxin--NADP+ reductase